MRLKDLLKDKVPKEKIELIPNSFEIIGSKEKAVAIVEINEDLKEFEKDIAKTIISLNKNVKTILTKRSKRRGEERLREFEIIYGESNTEVLHKEFGYVLKLDPLKVYFSPREALERKRIASKVKQSEEVLIMFSGVAPFAIAIAKLNPVIKKIYCIELNKDAHRYAEENVRINKVSHLIVLINGDVREVSKKLNKKFDRILMPLPLRSLDYIDIAVKLLKEKGTIHFYSISDEKNLFNDVKEKLNEKLKKTNITFSIKDQRKVLPYAPRKWKVCLDIEVMKKTEKH